MALFLEQFNKLATKADFNELKSGLFLLKNEFNEFKNDVFVALDGVVKKLGNIEHEFIFNIAAHDRFKNRISRLENKS